MTWLLLSLLGLVLIISAIFYFVFVAKSYKNKTLGTISFILDFIFSIGSGAILIGLLLIIIGIVMAGKS
ncbi:hypothetical protein AN964_22215 [Heyndrickxia shackletonii]|uniref:Uncharacterized protein n=1 Tax=Heyndrickxia shackletonii TaxID=157838 RepID=A0A0Q3TA32_9BACI|nr:hypothetical protein [Heyndrickxia shackletonii]KQL50385.1 hypothetical protein AN964_22215 [Heyndrickxia shackletonii]MBB2479409.1 hypothetical protein [Bacillus sp. APMAM]NEZ00842.1 hypothetical protein [Heyndrickxia shackletonii]